MDRDILNRYTPYKFIQERDDTGKLTGVRTEFHKSFLRAKAEEARRQEERSGS